VYPALLDVVAYQDSHLSLCGGGPPPPPLPSRLTPLGIGFIDYPLSQVFCRRWLLDHVYQQASAELGLEPCRFRRHDSAGVGDRHEIGNAHRIERERHGGLAGVDQSLELARSSHAADEIDALVGAQVDDL